jgi:hypothetical protein
MLGSSDASVTPFSVTSLLLVGDHARLAHQVGRSFQRGASDEVFVRSERDDVGSSLGLVVADLVVGRDPREARHGFDEGALRARPWVLGVRRVRARPLDLPPLFPLSEVRAMRRALTDRDPLRERLEAHVVDHGVGNDGGGRDRRARDHPGRRRTDCLRALGARARPHHHTTVGSRVEWRDLSARGAIEQRLCLAAREAREIVDGASTPTASLHRVAALHLLPARRAPRRLGHARTHAVALVADRLLKQGMLALERATHGLGLPQTREPGLETPHAHELRVRAVAVGTARGVACVAIRVDEGIIVLVAQRQSVSRGWGGDEREPRISLHGCASEAAPSSARAELAAVRSGEVEVEVTIFAASAPRTPHLRACVTWIDSCSDVSCRRVWPQPLPLAE